MASGGVWEGRDFALNRTAYELGTPNLDKPEPNDEYWLTNDERRILKSLINIHHSNEPKNITVPNYLLKILFWFVQVGFFTIRTIPTVPLCGYKRGRDGIWITTGETRGTNDPDTRYKGMLPCFFGGLHSLLFWVISNAWINLKRVSLGYIISSI